MSKLNTVKLIMIISLFAILSMGCTSNETVVPLGIKDGRLSDCPASPNCVSSQSNDPEKRMPSLPFINDLDNSRQIIQTIVESMSRSKIIAVQEDYLHVEFRSAIFRFVDDVEFVFDKEESTIHFRSASRTGYSDLGVNRKRMTAISEKYLSN